MGGGGVVAAVAPNFAAPDAARWTSVSAQLWAASWCQAALEMETDGFVGDFAVGRTPHGSYKSHRECSGSYKFVRVLD